METVDESNPCDVGRCHLLRNPDALPHQCQVIMGKCGLDVPPDGFDVQALQGPDARSKYLDQKQKYYNYQRKRKKLRKERTKRTRSLLLLLNKLNGLLDQLEQQLSAGIQMPCQILPAPQGDPQSLPAATSDVPNRGKYPDRIVSLSKSYIRPIVRGQGSEES